MTTFTLVILGYVLGSIPFAFLLSRRTRGIDIRYAGSGNVGAANVLRTSGLGTAVAVLLLDLAKGAGSVAVAQRLAGGDGAPAAVGLAAIVGHVYPVWLRFRGGKGVATACGVFAVLTPAAMLPALLVFFTAAWLSRFISLGSLLATVSLPPLAYVAGAPPVVIAAAAGAASIILLRHRSNLTRLAAGTERRIGQRVRP